MNTNGLCYYYRVTKHDTAITMASAMHLTCAGITKGRTYALPPDAEMFFGYPSLVRAMEMAKAGALAYINTLIAKGEQGVAELKQYRVDHYEDLNINLLEANIRKVESDPLPVTLHNS